MKCHDIEHLWDEYRDGTLASSERGRFAAHLAECPRCAAQYAQETRWLAGLNQEQPAARDPWFTEAVLQQWEHPPITWVRWIKWSGVAAALALAATVAVLMLAPADPRGQIAQAPSSDPTSGGGDPVSVLMLDMTRHLDDQPTSTIRRALDRTASLSLRDLMDMFEAGEADESDPRERRG